MEAISQMKEQTEKVIDWDRRQSLLEEIALLKEEREKVVASLKENAEAFEALNERGKELSVDWKRLKDEERKVLQKIDAAQGRLISSAPPEIAVLIRKYRERIESHRVLGGKDQELWVRRSPNPYTGNTIIESNDSEIQEGDRKLQLAIDELETLKITATGEAEAFTSLSEIKARVEGELKRLSLRPIELET